MKDIVSNADVLQMIAILEREGKVYHWLFDNGRVYLELDSITAELNVGEPPLLDLRTERRPNRLLTIVFA